MLRGLRITLLAAVLIPLFLLRRPFDRKAGPVLLRRFLQSAGAGFVKLGQILGHPLRSDFGPPIQKNCRSCSIRCHHSVP